MIKQTRYTPGPWHISLTHNGRAYDIGAANGANIALVSGPDENGADEFKANARLIAALPELIDGGEAMAETALQLIKAFCSDEDWHDIANRLNDQVYAFRGVSIAAARKGGE